MNFIFARPQWEEMREFLKGYERKLSELYEFWCYFKLLKIMEKLSDSRLDYEDVSKLNSNKWDVNLKVGMNSIQTFNLTIEDNKIKINLFYNKSFKKISPYKSYSLNLRPDYTLEINFKDKYYFLHFDAKYKSTGISNGRNL